MLSHPVHAEWRVKRAVSRHAISGYWPLRSSRARSPLDAIAARSRGVSGRGKDKAAFNANSGIWPASRWTDFRLRAKPEARHTGHCRVRDRKSVVEGKRVSVRVDLGGRGLLKKKT